MTTTLTRTVLRKTIYLRASKTEVWAYLTDPDKLGEWLHKPKTALVKGAKLEMFGAESGDLILWGEVREARPCDYLEYTFGAKPMGDTLSLVKWTLEEVAGGTQLSLMHEGLPQGAEAFGVTLAFDAGWDKHFSRLRAAFSWEE